jgi:hypothetical protein
MEEDPILGQIEILSIADTLDREAMEGLLRAVTRTLDDLSYMRRQEKFEQYETAFSNFAGWLRSRIDENPGDVDAHYCLGRLDQILDSIDMAFDRSISEAAIKQLKENPIQRKILDALRDDEISFFELQQRLGSPEGAYLVAIKRDLEPIGLVQLARSGGAASISRTSKGKATLLAAVEEILGIAA